MSETNIERHRFVKGFLALKGLTFSSIAKEAGVTRQLVSAVSKGQRRSKMVEEVLIKHGIPKSFLEAI